MFCYQSDNCFGLIHGDSTIAIHCVLGRGELGWCMINKISLLCPSPSTEPSPGPGPRSGYQVFLVLVPVSVLIFGSVIVLVPTLVPVLVPIKLSS